MPLCSTQTRVSAFLLWSLLPKLSTLSATTLVLAVWYLARHNSVTRSALLATNLSAHRSRKIILQTGLLFELSFLDPSSWCFPPVFCFGPDSLPCCFRSLCVKMTLEGGVYHHEQRCWVLVAWSTPTSILVAEQWLSTNTSLNP